jgi:hypothetical protein
MVSLCLKLIPIYKIQINIRLCDLNSHLGKIMMVTRWVVTQASLTFLLPPSSTLIIANRTGSVPII